MKQIFIRTQDTAKVGIYSARLHVGFAACVNKGYLDFTVEIKDPCAVNSIVIAASAMPDIVAVVGDPSFIGIPIPHALFHPPPNGPC